MHRHRLTLSIPAEKYIALYGGKVKSVRAYSETGLRVEFPGNILHRFVTRDGVYGRFELCIDNDNKLKSIERLQAR
jgi:glutathionylspermidine synthase